MVRRTVDTCMTILMIILMAYQVTGELLHEWIGVSMTLLVIVHQILNRKWYCAFFKGKYNTYHTVTTAVNAALVLSFLLTAFCGMSMSSHAVPFMYGIAKISFARRMHLSMSHWAFVLMGLHLGLHIPLMLSGLKLTGRKRIIVNAVMCCLAGAGLYCLLQNRIADYLFFRVPFAFLDYEKAGILVFLENVLIMVFWAFTGAQLFHLFKDKDKDRRTAVIFIMAAVIAGMVLSDVTARARQR